MRTMWICVLASLAASAGAGSADAQAQVASIRATRVVTDGMDSDLGMGVKLNPNSSLRRQGVVIHDPGIPAKLSDSIGVSVEYADRSYGYRTVFTLTPLQDLSAVEVRFIVFNVFGERAQVLSDTEVRDIRAGMEAELHPTWRLIGEAEAARHFASIAYVARVRTATGKVITADLAPILAEARKFSQEITMAELQPRRPEK